MEIFTALRDQAKDESHQRLQNKTKKLTPSKWTLRSTNSHRRLTAFHFGKRNQFIENWSSCVTFCRFFVVCNWPTTGSMGQASAKLIIEFEFSYSLLHTDHHWTTTRPLSRQGIFVYFVVSFKLGDSTFFSFARWFRRWCWGVVWKGAQRTTLQNQMQQLCQAS